ncbi:hypothetical protein H310_10809 [Aphanomyces invadans]|uniref:Uncharacterized protein n=1 Tax=Aphanomyces invadans TaxID=157072 RepID=A0A024TQ33_9STRA|nr:hypothetical protein H310_10809 [Aphanomyces invadans]ETV95736.1 hypothetical protein H310_10809 [Aphanomyces invadans]|eukprot:XP_008875487.1 hypothetical protein H310_10809 [Aphanomyces invadans]
MNGSAESSFCILGTSRLRRSKRDALPPHRVAMATLRCIRMARYFSRSSFFRHVILRLCRVRWSCARRSVINAVCMARSWASNITTCLSWWSWSSTSCNSWWRALRSVMSCISKSMRWISHRIWAA